MTRALQISLLFTALCYASAAPAEGLQEGQVLVMNERGGTVTLKLKDGSTKEYRLRDGLVFQRSAGGGRRTVHDRPRKRTGRSEQA